MNVSIRLENNLLILTPYQVLNQNNSLMIQHLLSCRTFPPFTAIRFDLSHVFFIDSSGLGLILFVAHSQKGKAGQTDIVGPKAQVLELLERAKLTEIVPIAEQ